MPDANWKRIERKVAKVFGLSRRVGIGRSVGDLTDHPLFTIEVKFRKALPLKFVMDGLKQAKGYAPTKIPVLVSKKAGMQDEIVSLYFSDFAKLLKDGVIAD